MLAHSNLKMRQVAEYYGYKINREGYINCPLHREKTPSLKIYDKSFYCFGCASGGSVIDFVMKVFVVDFKTALAKINEDFRIKNNRVDYRHLKKVSDINKAKEKIHKKQEHCKDIEFRILWLKHKGLRQLAPYEEFWENLEKLLKLEDFKYNGL